MKKPFSHPKGECYFGHEDIKTGELPLETHIKGTIESATGNNDKLHYLCSQYMESIAEAETKALCDFFSLASELLKDKFLKENEWEILSKASMGDIPSIRLLVLANPEMINLPFVRDGLQKILNNHKYGKDITFSKSQWLDFLNKRSKNKILHSRGSLRRLVDRVRIGINAEIKKPLSRRERVIKKNAESVVADKMGISEHTIKKLISEKGKRPGRRKMSK